MTQNSFNCTSSNKLSSSFLYKSNTFELVIDQIPGGSFANYILKGCRKETASSFSVRVCSVQIYDTSLMFSYVLIYVLIAQS